MQMSSNKRKQVKKACTNCRKAHAACEPERPCKRCKKFNLEVTCIDHQRKKRKLKQAEQQTQWTVRQETGFTDVGGNITADAYNLVGARAYIYPTNVTCPVPHKAGVASPHSPTSSFVTRLEFVRLDANMNQIMTEIGKIKSDMQHVNLRLTHVGEQLKTFTGQPISAPIMMNGNGTSPNQITIPMAPQTLPFPIIPSTTNQMANHYQYPSPHQINNSNNDRVKINPLPQSCTFSQKSPQINNQLNTNTTPALSPLQQIVIQNHSIHKEEKQPIQNVITPISPHSNLLSPTTLNTGIDAGNN